MTSDVVSERNQHEQRNQLKDSNFMCGSIKYSQVGGGGGGGGRGVQLQIRVDPTNPDPGLNNIKGLR